MQNIIKNQINKRGLSEIVTVVLILTLTILAVTILASVVIKIAKAPKLSPEYNCLDVKIKNLVTIESSCYNQNTQDIQVSLKRNLQNLEIKNIGFIINNQEYICGNFCGNCNIVSNGNSETYYIFQSERPEDIKIKINNCLISTKKITTC